MKDVIRRFLDGESNEYNFFFYFQFGEGEDFHFISVIVGYLHKSHEYVNGCIVADRSVRPLRCSLMFLALVMNSNSFSTLQIIFSSFLIVMTNICSSRCRISPSCFGCWMCILMNPSNFG